MQRESTLPAAGVRPPQGAAPAPGATASLASSLCPRCLQDSSEKIFSSELAALLMAKQYKETQKVDSQKASCSCLEAGWR